VDVLSDGVLHDLGAFTTRRNGTGHTTAGIGGQLTGAVEVRIVAKASRDIVLKGKKILES
jgi:hypothetical protein